MNQEQNLQPNQPPNNGQVKAIISLILGVLACFTPIPLLGLGFGVVGIILAGRAKIDGFRGGTQIAGFVVSIVGIVVGSFVTLSSTFLSSFLTWWGNWMF